MKSVMKLIDADDVINRIQQYSKKNNTLYEFSQKNVILLLQKAPEVNINDIKSETVKEFAEKLKEYLSKLEANSPNKTYKTAMQDMLDYYFPKIIDDVAKEMRCNDG